MVIQEYIFNMFISIIIVVKGDRGILNTLNQLDEIIKPYKMEIIVIDAAPGKLDEIKALFPKIKWFYYDKKPNKRYTISEQRNMGISKALGDTIIFLDSNCVPIKEWLVEIVKPVIDDNEFIVAGNVKAIDKKTVNSISDERFKGKYLDEAPTLNLLIKRNVFDKIGTFDEDIIYGEDTDLTWRAVDAGYKIRHAKKAIIYHDWGDFKEQLHRAIRYGEVRTNLYIKRPDKLKDIFKNESIIVLIYPLFILLLPIIFFFPYYPLLLLIPIIKNWKHSPIFTTVLNLFFGFGIWKGLIARSRYQ